jgi:hypothetical protein
MQNGESKGKPGRSNLVSRSKSPSSKRRVVQDPPFASFLRFMRRPACEPFPRCSQHRACVGTARNAGSQSVGLDDVAVLLGALDHVIGAELAVTLAAQRVIATYSVR